MWDKETCLLQKCFKSFSLCQWSLTTLLQFAKFWWTLHFVFVSLYFHILPRNHYFVFTQNFVYLSHRYKSLFCQSHQFFVLYPKVKKGWSSFKPLKCKILRTLLMYELVSFCLLKSNENLASDLKLQRESKNFCL